MRQLLTAPCKQAPYQARTMQELRDIQDKWRRKKATGPDRVSNEALSFFLAHNDTANKLHWALEGALYKARSPTAALQDITILLPKQAPPAQWKDTRPTTLSNAIDRAMAQLLLHRCYDQLLRDPGHPSRQAKSWKTRYARKAKHPWFKASRDGRVRRDSLWTPTCGNQPPAPTTHDQRLGA